MTESKSQKRRNLIKNIAIIFLVILLILTFFSNTILNASLPEVAYDYPSSGTISGVLRGTGTVSSNETYEIAIEESRTVKAVAIEVGDTVEAGDSLIMLTEEESDELTAAREELSNLQLAYQKALLELEYDTDTASAVQLEILQAQLQSAIDDQSEATTGDSKITAAEAKVDSAQAAYDAAVDAYEALEDALGASSSVEKANLVAAQSAYDDAVAAQTQAKTNLEYVQSISGGDDYDDVLESYETAAEEYIELQEELAELTQELQDLSSAQITLERLEDKVDAAQDEVDELKDELDTAEESYDKVTSAIKTLVESSSASSTSSTYNATTSIYVPDDVDEESTEITYQIVYVKYSEKSLKSYKSQLESWLKSYNNHVYDDYTNVETVAGYVAESIYKLEQALEALSSNDEYDEYVSIDYDGEIVVLYGLSLAELLDYQEDLADLVEDLTDDYNDAVDELEDLQDELSDEETDAETTASSVASDIKSKESEITSKQKELSKKAEEMEELEATINNTSFSEAYQELLVANELVNTTNQALYDAQVAYDAVYSTDELDELQEVVDDAKEDLEDAESDLQSLEAKYSQDADTAYQAVLSAEKALQEYYDSLTSEDLAAAQNDLDLAAQAEDIEAAEEKVAELEENASESIIVAEYGGIVTEMNVGPGTITTAGETMVVIERTDNGYTLSFSVTTDEASNVKVGDQAEIVNQFNTDITAVLSNITTDTDNPGTNKLLVFTISGDDVVSGQSLTLSIGERSSTYDLVVPNSAVRTDSSGDFVLAITIESGPLGNTYVATRVDVEVLASDDDNSAISGNLSQGDTIITTSTTSISSGDQVRLADS